MSDAKTLDIYARQRDAYVAMMDKEVQRDPVIAPFIAACRPGGRVLDLGCGPGHFARRMAEAGLETHAWDAVPEMVEYAATHPGVTARQARFEDLTVEDHYDGIWAYFSLLHAPRPDFPRHLAAIARALKSGGVFVLAVKRGSGGGRDDLGRHYEYYEQPELEAQLRAASLRPEEHWTGVSTGLSGHPADWIAILSRG